MQVATNSVILPHPDMQDETIAAMVKDVLDDEMVVKTEPMPKLERTDTVIDVDDYWPPPTPVKVTWQKAT